MTLASGNATRTAKFHNGAIFSIFMLKLRKVTQSRKPKKDLMKVCVIYAVNMNNDALGKIVVSGIHLKLCMIQQRVAFLQFFGAIVISLQPYGCSSPFFFLSDGA